MSCYAEKSLLITFLLVALVTNCYLLEPQIGCTFRDSINITDGYQEQGNYHHNGVVYSPQYYGTFDFVVINETSVAADPHVRGCVCAVQGNCVRVCCDPQREPCPTTFDGYLRKDTSEEPTYSEDLTKGMALVFGGLECQKYSINPQDDPFDNFTMLAVSGWHPMAYKMIHPPLPSRTGPCSSTWSMRRTISVSDASRM